MSIPSDFVSVTSVTSILKSLSIEPSGYLQWDEFDTTTFAAHTPASNVTKEGADELIQVWHKFAAKLDIQLGYFLSIYTILIGN